MGELVLNQSPLFPQTSLLLFESQPVRKLLLWK